MKKRVLKKLEWYPIGDYRSGKKVKKTDVEGQEAILDDFLEEPMILTHPEMKRTRLTLGAFAAMTYTIQSSSVQTRFPLVSRGTAHSQRSSMRVYVVDMHVCWSVGRIQVTGAGNSTGQGVWLAVVRDRRNQGSEVSPASYMEGYSTTVVNAHTKHEYRDRIQILWYKKFFMNPGHTYVQNVADVDVPERVGYRRFIETTIPLGFVVSYNGTGGAVEDISKNLIQVVCGCDDALLVEHTWSITCRWISI